MASDRFERSGCFTKICRQPGISRFSRFFSVHWDLLTHTWQHWKQTWHIWWQKVFTVWPGLICCHIWPPLWLMNGLGASIDHERHQQKCAAASLSSINTRRTGFKLYFTIWVVLFVLKAVIRSEWVWIACDVWCYEVGVGLPLFLLPTDLPHCLRVIPPGFTITSRSGHCFQINRPVSSLSVNYSPKIGRKTVGWFWSWEQTYNLLCHNCCSRYVLHSATL